LRTRGSFVRSEMRGEAVTHVQNESETSSDESSPETKHAGAYISVVLLVILLGTMLSACMVGTLVYFYMFPGEGNQSQLLEVISFIPFFQVKELPTYEQCFALCLCTILLTLLANFHFYRTFLYMQLNMPHAKSKLPFPLGCIIEFLSSPPWDNMTAWHRQYGSIYSFTLLGRHCVSVANPMYLKTILQSKIRNVKKDVQFAYAPFLSILGTGIVTSEGHSWKDQRLAVSAVLRHDVLDMIPKITLRAVQRLCQDVLDPASKSGEAVDLSEHLRHLTLQVISETFFSLPAHESDTTLATMYLPIMEESHKRVWHPERNYAFFLPAFWINLWNVYRLNTFISNLIIRRWSERQKTTNENNGASQDVLGRIFVVYETKKQVSNLSSQDVRQLRDEMKTFILAGHETSASMMTWAFMEVLRPDTKEAEEMRNKARKEASQIFDPKQDWSKASLGVLPPRSDLDKLYFSLACLKVSLISSIC